MPYDDVTITVYNYPMVLIGVGLIAAIAMTWGYFSPWIQGKRMKKERREFIENEVTYEFTEVIEDGIIDDRWSREEANEMYLKLKRCFPIKNLFPSVGPLKEGIQKRLNNQTHAPVELPDAVPKKQKHMFDKS